MNPVVALALKDLRLMPRNKGGMFFTLVWPIVLMVLFGFAFGGNARSGGESAKVAVAIVDDDQTEASRAFVSGLAPSLDLAAMSRGNAEAAVRLGRRAAFLVIKPGFGEASRHFLSGPSKEVELGVDPVRQAEAGMIQGLLMKQAGTAILTRFSRGGGGGEPWQPIKITSTAVSRERRGPENAFDVTFPQGIVWGLIGCVMTFGISLVTERTHGTLVRLRMAPLTRTQILGGKALACFATIMLVEVILLAVAFGFGVRPSSLPMLALAGVSAAVCFVGFMMLVASLGKTEQTASGAGWAILMPMSMLGGAMVPQFVMPQWMQTVGMISPIRWVILAVEGGIWRQFTLSEMVLPCAILISVGVACFAAGTRGLREA